MIAQKPWPGVQINDMTGNFSTLRRYPSKQPAAVVQRQKGYLLNAAAGNGQPDKHSTEAGETAGAVIRE